MILLLIILFVAIIFCGLNYYLHNKDLYSPAVITFLSLIAGVIFSVMGIYYMGETITILTTVALIVGMLAITGGALLSLKFKSYGKNIDECYYVKHSVVRLFTILCVFMTALYGLEAYRVGIRYGGTGLNSFAYMKQSYSDGSDAQKMNIFIRQGFKFVQAIGYVNSLYLIRNIVNRHSDRINYTYAISLISSLCIVIFSGSRTEIIRTFSSCLCIFSIIYREKYGWTLKGNKKASGTIKKLIPYGVILVLLFFVTRRIVKTENVTLSSTNSILSYLSFYFGGALFVLNKKICIAYGNIGDMLIGNETARVIAPMHVYLGKLNFGGNTSTIFEGVLYRGLLGMSIHLIIVFFLFTSIYKSYLLGSTVSVKRDTLLIIFGMVYFPFVLAFYTDCVSMSINSSSIIIMLIAIIYFRMSIKRSEKQL